MDLGLDRILRRADATLDSREAGEARPPRLEAFKRFLKIETERLRIRHRFGLGGREIASGRSYLVDLVLERACQLAATEVAPLLPAEQDQLAVVALGGYGRSELAPYSDVDVLFLRSDRAGAGIKALVERVLALLWDAGLTVGHSFRTVAECVAMGRDDLPSRTALTEARLVTGSPTLFARLIAQMDALVFASARTTGTFLQSLRFDLGERYARYGGAVGLQEPQVKESAGGLRDLHVVLWVGHALFGARGLAALHEQKHISAQERRAATRAYDHLCRIRNEAHFTTGRKTDLLSLDLQPTLAENLGYRDLRGLRASEIFMRDYYRRADELHRFSAAFLVRHAPPPARRRFSLALLRRPSRGPFEIRDGELYSRHPASALGNPRRLFEAFAIAQTEGPELSQGLKLDIRASLHLVNGEFRASREAGRLFLRLLERPGRVAPTLRAMHETGLLGRLLPEFARVTFLVQHDYYHRFTVDEHTLTAVDALDAVAASPDPALAPFVKVFGEVERASTLYLGMLLHDIGKGHGGGHVTRGVRIAERLCARLGIDERTTADVSLLVDAHLEMSRISQRRDLSEPGLIEAFALRMGTLDRLNMLFLLTYADHHGVGPGIWNEWKAALLWDLYARTRTHLDEGKAPAPSRRRESERDQASQKLVEEFPPSQVERHFALMPDRYLRTTDAAEMVRHFRLLQRLAERLLAVEWRSAGHHTIVAIATPDHPGLFAQLAGTLTAQGLDILSVDLYTRQDGAVVDVFKVREVGDHGPVDVHRRAAIEAALVTAVDGRYDVAAAVEKRSRSRPRRLRRRALAAPTVRFDAVASAACSVVEVRAEDEPGLAYRIASALASCGLNISFAKIATEKSHALDVFYVTDAAGGKLDAGQEPRIEATVIAALGARPATHS